MCGLFTLTLVAAMPLREYPCEFCGTDQPQINKLVTLTRRHKGKVFVFENVPALVCPNCGHKMYDNLMILRLEQIMQHTPPEAQPLEAYSITLPVPQ